MEKYKVTGLNNFCRVFQVPSEFPKGYCFGGGLDTNFKMQDWFNPVSIEWGGDSEQEVDAAEVKESLIDFLNKKKYTTEGKKYLVMCNFGFDFTFICKKQ